MPGAVTCGTCDPLQIPGSPVLEELTKLKRKKFLLTQKRMAGLVYSQVSQDKFTYTPLHLTPVAFKKESQVTVHSDLISLYLHKCF